MADMTDKEQGALTDKFRNALLESIGKLMANEVMMSEYEDMSVEHLQSIVAALVDVTFDVQSIFNDENTSRRTELITHTLQLAQDRAASERKGLA